jgi:hypothetical protein
MDTLDGGLIPKHALMISFPDSTIRYIQVGNIQKIRLGGNTDAKVPMDMCGNKIVSDSPPFSQNDTVCTKPWVQCFAYALA